MYRKRSRITLVGFIGDHFLFKLSYTVFTIPRAESVIGCMYSCAVTSELCDDASGFECLLQNPNAETRLPWFDVAPENSAYGSLICSRIGYSNPIEKISRPLMLRINRPLTGKVW